MLLTLIVLLALSSALLGAQTTVPPSSASEHHPNFKVIYESPNSVCYADNKAYLCTPPFTNIAEGIPVVATSTCGQGGRAERVCKSWTSQNGQKRQTYCETCDSRKAATSRGAERLTDRHITSNQTCWVSGKVAPGSTVNLTLSLGKRFEIFYISLQPCGPLPDSIALYKSSDFGRTWKPWQYFSTDCYRAFGLPTSSEHNAQISSANIQEVLCVAIKPPVKYNAQGQVSNVIAFSTTIGRPTSQSWSPALIDWMTMTDLQISLSRFPARRKSRTVERSGGDNTVVLHRRDRSSGQRRVPQKAPVFRLGGGRLFHQGAELEEMQADGTTLNATASTATNARNEVNTHEIHHDEDDAVYFAFSDIAVGGRCKCNGHANRCVRDRIVEKNAAGEEIVTWGPLRCDCQHNTVGADCERCAPGYLDRPWARATNEDANECKACECNLHSNSCTFSQYFYLLSKKVSGGVCEDCRHHTTGEKCHQCMEGFYRDWTKPISHPMVCLKCQCHPIGSIGSRPCDRKTGQCHCKTGVTGQTCNRCLDGYKQTRSKITPCVKAVDALVFAGSATRSSPQTSIVGQPTADDACPPCEKNNKRFRFKKFCRRQAVFRATVISQEARGELVRLVIRIHDVWRNKGSLAQRYLPAHVRRNQAPIIPLWVPLTKKPSTSRESHAVCVCPRFKIDQSYLFISQVYEIPFHERNELLLDQKSTILPWVENWRRRLMRFAIRQERGRCDAVSDDPYSQVRITPDHRRNLIRPRNSQYTHSAQVNPQPRTPRHYYSSEGVQPIASHDLQPPMGYHAPVMPWSKYQYRSMRHFDRPVAPPQS
uniref:Netrin-A n=1 Tax=Mesocestoides corti TaxID=53468 RepID=A0A5K3F9D3_MESCO